MLRRVLAEHRRFLTVVVGALAVNLAAYALLVRPMQRRVAAADRRAADAAAALRGAERELAAAQGVAEGKARAEKDLEVFYRDVLPAGLSAANRATYLGIAQLARKAGVTIARREATPETRRDSSLEELAIGLVVEGSYANIRQFVYELESTPAFVVIRDLSIDQGREEGGALVLSLGVSTYYRASDHAS